MSASFQRAALNLPVPDHLLDLDDSHQWRFYLGCLPPWQLLKTFGQALDQLHQLVGTDDMSKMPEDKQALVYAKFEATVTVNAVVSPKFLWHTQEMEENPRMFKSDFARTIYSVCLFLENMNSADTGIWEQRLKVQKALSESTFPKFLTNYTMKLREIEEAREEEAEVRESQDKPKPSKGRKFDL
jgi:hypothetical protein